MESVGFWWELFLCEGLVGGVEVEDVEFGSGDAVPCVEFGFEEEVEGIADAEGFGVFASAEGDAADRGLADA